MPNKGLVSRTARGRYAARMSNFYQGTSPYPELRIIEVTHESVWRVNNFKSFLMNKGNILHLIRQVLMFFDLYRRMFVLSKKNNYENPSKIAFPVKVVVGHFI